jgi:hypothetical protein
MLAAPCGAVIAKRRSLREHDLADHTMLGHCLRDQALAVCERGGAVQAMEVPAALVPRGAIAVVPFAKPAPGRTIGRAWRDQADGLLARVHARRRRA